MDVISFVDGAWRPGRAPLMHATTQAAWLSAAVFDGARAFQGVAPDLDLHCARLLRSAAVMGLDCPLTAGEICELCLDGVGRFPPGSELYIRPMLFAEDGLVAYEPDAARFAIVIHRAPMPPDAGFSACMAAERRPAPDQAPTEAKASCLYPLMSIALRKAKARGFQSAVMRDPIGNVAEFAGSNLFVVKDGVAATPIANRTFLAGITRARVIALLRADGVPVEERVVAPEELDAADEIFSTGNYAKVLPVTRWEARDLQPGPVYRRARQLYFDWALSARA